MSILLITVLTFVRTYSIDKQEIAEITKVNSLVCINIQGDKTMNPKYERDSTYRERYISAHPPKNGKYRCVYCGRLVPKEKMEVDHVVAVDRVKKNWLYRLCVPNGVNDISNLVCSCHRCNHKKSSKGGLWIIRGHFWKVVLPIYITIKIVLACAILAFVTLAVMGFFGLGPAQNIYNSIVDVFISWMNSFASEVKNFGTWILDFAALKIKELL